ncbi:MAG: hypothetical protein U0930_03910 [Pirellulales bacterium]
MSANGPGILQHDLARDILAAFFERFNRGEEAQAVATALQDEFTYSALDVVEKEVFCTAIIESLWQVGTSHEVYEQLLTTLNDIDAMRAYWGDALPKRVLAVRRLMIKVRTPKSKPRKPKAIRKERARLFQQGDYVLYHRSNGRFVALIFWQSENCFGIQYYFAVPNLSRVSDPQLIEKFLRPDTLVTEGELEAFFTTKKRFRITTVKEKLVRSHRQLFTTFKQGEFPPDGWAAYGGSSHGATTIEQFERFLNDSGSRSLTEQEVIVTQLTGTDR